jgi:hypothetical protein
MARMVLSTMPSAVADANAIAADAPFFALLDTRPAILATLVE